MLSAICFSLYQSKILPSGNGLNTLVLFCDVLSCPIDHVGIVPMLGEKLFQGIVQKRSSNVIFKVPIYLLFLTVRIFHDFTCYRPIIIQQLVLAILRNKGFENI